jgi:Na+-transporting NADH:ubiquinone oxidoreductase subunit NqrF
LNKYLEIIIIVAVLSIVLASLKLAHGQSGNLTVNQTNRIAQNQTVAYGDALMDVIKNANITIPSDLHPTTEQLEKIADEIVEGGHPNKILNEMRSQNKS